MNKKYL